MLILLSKYALPLELSPEQYKFWNEMFDELDLVVLSF
jgi:hypothetical protein